MVNLVVLASGSSGNSLLIEGGGTRLLIDAGLSAKKLGEKLTGAGCDPGSLDGVLLTHEHGDHARGLARLCSRHGIPVYANAGTAEALGRGRDGDALDWRLFRTGAGFQVGGMEVESFAVPHDACDPVGLVLSCGGESIGVLTDLGHAGRAVLERVARVDALVIEANHDPDLLQADTKRPWGVKQRIVSRHGHLSNTAAADVVTHCLAHRLQRVVLGHLSRDCNRADLARQAVASRLHGGRLDLHVVCQDDPALALPTLRRRQPAEPSAARPAREQVSGGPPGVVL